jgi:hypothetical protein
VRSQRAWIEALDLPKARIAVALQERQPPGVVPRWTAKQFYNHLTRSEFPALTQDERALIAARAATDATGRGEAVAGGAGAFAAGDVPAGEVSPSRGVESPAGGGADRVVPPLITPHAPPVTAPRLPLRPRPTHDDLLDGA